jgi:8-oxo-dGTP pyrophosphatase MutT (NUDIX family)
MTTLIIARHSNAFKVLENWSPKDNEMFPVFTSVKREHVLDIPCVASPLFGIIGRGVQLVVYQEDVRGKLSVWVAKRSTGRKNFPGMLGATVDTPLTPKETALECLVREAGEEASLDERLVRARARACGTVSYMYATDEKSGGESGLVCPEVQFVYEICVSEEIVPKPCDGEVEKFELLDVDMLREKLEREEFRPASACVMIDFLVRHGILTAENEKDYEEITQGLHRPMDFLATH